MDVPMFRYRMNSRTPRMGWVLAVLVIGLLLIIIAGQLGGGQRQVTSQPDTTQADPGGVLPRLWESFRAGLLTIWNSISGAPRAQPVIVDLDAPSDSPQATAQGVNTGSGSDEEDVPLPNDVIVEVVKPLEPDAYVPVGLSPQVLIYHTHTHEAYSKQPDQDYVEAAKWRTTNNTYNIVKVGEALARELSAKYGIAVLQDKTDTEYPKLGTSYSRSLKTVQKTMETNKDLKILIDLHRDAYNKSINPSTVTINGIKVARIMFVIGTGQGQTGVGFTEKPDWKKNLALANAIKDRLAAMDPNLVRETSVKTGRYNQHLSPGSILIEVGHNENTLEEALNAVPFLAQAIAGAYYDLSNPATKNTTTSTPVATPTEMPSGTGASTSSTQMPASSPSAAAPQVIVIDPVSTPKPNQTRRPS